MDYPYESLNPERFQEFCQALLIHEQPGVTCLPVAQPDGGRDMVVQMFTSASKFVVYQVKFVRNPEQINSPHKWLVDIVRDEAPKIWKLIPRGAVGFYLITNVRGTAHLDSGSIDQIHEVMAQHIEIPSVCWWRDDLNRRMDSAWDLKWTYPELMTGPDLIRAIIESGLHEDQERRASAIRAFVRDQYDRDKEVRFKQVELQNSLLDLFIDVPVEPRTPVGNRRERYRFWHAWQSLERTTTGSYSRDLLSVGAVPPDLPIRNDQSDVGAASMFLDRHVQQSIPKIVLEGAPGQGKSTITQYVSQVHRMRILREDCELARTDETHRSAPVRLPFRVDLRDLAAWLSRKDPFSAEDVQPPSA